MGCDSNSASSSISLIVFQFTHPVWGATTTGQAMVSRPTRFNSRTPCGVRHCMSAYKRTHSVFQFTHPVWGATSDANLTVKQYVVSIHAPRVGCDGGAVNDIINNMVFQFTHPVWGATHDKRQARAMTTVSIHAPRVGCDLHYYIKYKSTSKRFQFTHPVWGATHEYQERAVEWMFQFTHPVWGATITVFIISRNITVSIHAPRVGCGLRRAR